MSYTAVIDRANPTAFLFLIDQSRSMNEKMDTGESKAKLVGDVLNKTLLQLIARCGSPDGVRDYFDIGVLAYNGIGVRSGFGGALGGSALHPISSLAAHPLRIEESKKSVPDGAGNLVNQSFKFPVWFEWVSYDDAPMSEGFRKAAEYLVSWCNSHGKSYPPTLIHVAGGPSTDGDPEQLAEAIRHISTNHGQCLLFNLHLNTSGSASVIFPESEDSLPDPYSKMLFRMSSLIPVHLIKPAQEKRYSASSESRFFGYRAGYDGLVNFFDIGTQVSNLLFREPTSPQTGQTFARQVTGSTTSPLTNWQSTEPATPQPAAPVPAEPVGAVIGRRRLPSWSQSVRVLGMAVAVVAAILLFKLFGIGRGPQPIQSTNRTTTELDNASVKQQSSANGQSAGSSGEPYVTGDTNLPDSVPLPDATKINPPADLGPKLAAGAQQATQPAPALMPRPKDIDKPNVAQTSTANPSSAAVETSTANPSSTAVETSAANPSSAATNLDLAKAPDAKRVQQRLIELGYFSGPASGFWGPQSKHALSEFSAAEKIGQDGHWDQVTEKKLFSSSAARNQQSLAFVGSWSKDASGCDPLIKITATGAMSRDATCHFNSIQQDAEGRWSAQAHCELAAGLRTADTENSWSARIKLTLDDRRLTWESEKGISEYYRCSHE
jgi:hypothetical protein